ncbi:MAG: VanZ family protein [Bacteroidales bacterium]
MYFWKSAIWLCIIIYLSFAPKSNFDADLHIFVHQDKLIHICMYALLTFLVITDFSKKHRYNTILISIILFSTIAISIIIEYLQPQISNRTFETYDIAANCIGACCGVAASVIFRKKYTLFSQK